MSNVKSETSLGVLVGCDEKQEWLLPWWWGHFTKNYPVAFADFGMSPKARAWCEKRGTVIPIPEPPAQRNVWFKKPLAMERSPFARTLWLDLDCEVRGDLDFLFSYPLSSARMTAVSVEIDQLHIKGTVREIPHYNSGVVLFEKGTLLDLWIRAISDKFDTEEDLLSFLIAYFEIPLLPLPHYTNWEVLKWGPNSNALIYHWMGECGKKAIRAKLVP